MQTYVSFLDLVKSFSTRIRLSRSRRELSNEHFVFTCKIRLRYSRERAVQSLLIPTLSPTNHLPWVRSIALFTSTTLSRTRILPFADTATCARSGLANLTKPNPRANPLSLRFTMQRRGLNSRKATSSSSSAQSCGRAPTNTVASLS